MPSFVAAAAVTWTASGASNSASRTIPTADGVILACSVYNGTGDTVASTIAAASPLESYQTASAASKSYLAAYIAAPAGAQTVVISGADAGDVWVAGFRGIDDIDTTDAFDGAVTDTASPASIAVTTSSDGLGFGVCYATTNISASDTLVWETTPSADGDVDNAASTPGTGGSVSIDWTAATDYWVSIAVNLRQVAAVGSTYPGWYGAGWF